MVFIVLGNCWKAGTQERNDDEYNSHDPKILGWPYQFKGSSSWKRERKNTNNTGVAHGPNL
jgi:hypothetical protein